MTNPVRLRHDPDPIQTWTTNEVRRWRAVRRPWSAIARDLKLSEAEAKRMWGWVEHRPAAVAPEPAPPEVVPEVVKGEAAAVVGLTPRLWGVAMHAAGNVLSDQGVRIARESDRGGYVRLLAAAGWVAWTGAGKYRTAEAFDVQGVSLAPAQLLRRGLGADHVESVRLALEQAGAA